MINSAISRLQFCGQISHDDLLLEIGPYARPQFSKSQHNVVYADICTSEQIRAQCAQHGYNPEFAPEQIDIIINPESEPSIITEHRFKNIFSSHVIEHQPDLVRHLCEMADLTVDNQSRYFVAIPDMRYCFDYWQTPSSIAEVIGAHIEKRKRLLPSTMLQTDLFSGHNNEFQYWNNQPGTNPMLSLTLDKIRNNMKSASKLLDEYVDGHAWRFIPETFVWIIDILHQLELQPWTVESAYTTAPGTNEFYIVLKLDTK